ncbi:hypothetical protein PG994_014559 [Apiospora phragmitis]|uniref:MYND-type domain-containing protein n=1 Tax=Apiospora phragmitis TaxID=2905665 RepID=A0ABR1T4N4_9PEZI
MPQSFEDPDFFPAHRICLDYWNEHENRFYVHEGHKYRIHWCLLGQITYANRSSLTILATDCDGQRFDVGLMTSRVEDDERLLPHFTVGNTIALFYAGNHRDMFFQNGQMVLVRVPSLHVRRPWKLPRRCSDAKVGSEKTDVHSDAQIFPLPMDAVLQMNRDVVEYGRAYGTKRRCHGCGKLRERMNLWMCGGCRNFHYCNVGCQTKGWKVKSHKRFCRIMRDINVQLMHDLDYSLFDDWEVDFYPCPMATPPN